MKKIIDSIIIEYFKNHKQIKHTFLGSEDAYNAIAIKQFMSTHIEFIEVNSDEYSRQYVYSVAVCDLIDVQSEDMISNLADEGIISDAIEILDDFFDVLSWKLSSDLVFTPTLQYKILPFYEDTVDRTVGAVANFSIIMLKKTNTCLQPVSLN